MPVRVWADFDCMQRATIKTGGKLIKCNATDRALFAVSATLDLNIVQYFLDA